MNPGNFLVTGTGRNWSYNSGVGGVPMRITGLLALLLLILILFFAAPAASFAQSSPNTSPFSARMTARNVTPENLADLARWARNGAQFERDGVCYTMRTYVMAREDKDSDATRVVRVTRCLPEWKLEFKSAIAPEPREENAVPTRR